MKEKSIAIFFYSLVFALLKYFQYFKTIIWQIWFLFNSICYGWIQICIFPEVRPGFTFYLQDVETNLTSFPWAWGWSSPSSRRAPRWRASTWRRSAQSWRPPAPRTCALRSSLWIQDLGCGNEFGYGYFGRIRIRFFRGIRSGLKNPLPPYSLHYQGIKK